MSRELFGTDGVRGLAGQYPLDTEGAVRIGMAVGAHFAQPGQNVAIASDPRESSAQLVDDIVEGLNKSGVNVVNIGVLPTPGLAYVTRQGDFAAGVMVTASHNPVEYNGVKVFDANGDKLSDDTEAELNKLIVDGVPEQGGGKASNNYELAKTYEDFLVNSAEGTQLTGLRIAVDSANGAASGWAERLFSRLGAEVKPMFDKPDGKNINDGCGATDTKALSQTVLGEGLDLGVAVDGDADRLMLIDSQGRELNGDYVLYIVAVNQKLEGAVATTMSNLGLENALEQNGIKLVRVKVGDRYVLEGLAKTGFHLGGEQSGHLIFPDMLKTGDALLAAVQTIKQVAASGKSLANWHDELVLLPQALVNVPVADKSKLEDPEVQDFIKQQQAEMAGAGRLLIRPSGTEPVARVMVESDDAQNRAQQIADKLEELING